jgi:hypothetical protein
MAAASQGGLEDVDQDRQDYDGAHDGDCPTIENAACTEPVAHIERLLQATASLGSHSFYPYHRPVDGEEQLSFAYA